MKLKTRELLEIATLDRNNNHVITMRKYNDIKEAIKKAVYWKRGKLNYLCAISLHSFK